MRISRIYREIVRFPLNIKNRKKLKNRDFTIISSNCIGGVIYHELNLQFRTPTINLWFEPNEFIKFLQSFDYYINQELIEIPSKYSYPVARCGDISIYFMHYNSFEEAERKWKERCKRINYQNLFVLMSISKDMPDNLVDLFNELPYRNKIIFTEKEIQAKSAYYIPIKRMDNEPYDLCKYKSKFSGKRWIDEFDYVSFLNENNCLR